MYTLVLIGCFNHFIFISFPLTFFLTSCIFQSKYSKIEMRVVPLAFWALALAAGVYLVKPRITDVFFVQHRLVVLSLFISFPLLGTVAYQLSRNRIQTLFWTMRGYIVSWTENLKVRKTITIFIYIIALIAVVCYAPLFIGNLANIYPLMKFFSYEPGFSYQLMGFSFIVILFYVLYKEQKSFDFSSKSQNKIFVNFITLFTLVYFFSFIVLTCRAQTRYLLIFNYLFMLSCALLINRYRKVIFLVIAITLPFPHSVLLSEINSNVSRKPFVFRIDHRKPHESSIGFIRTEGLYEILKKQNICRYLISNRKLRQTFLFYRLRDRFFCENREVAHCYPCSTSPFYCCEIKK